MRNISSELLVASYQFDRRGFGRFSTGNGISAMGGLTRVDARKSMYRNPFFMRQQSTSQAAIGAAFWRLAKRLTTMVIVADGVGVASRRRTRHETASNRHGRANDESARNDRGLRK